MNTKSISVKIIIFGLIGALGGTVGELISQCLRLNEGGRTDIETVIYMAAEAALFCLGVSVGLLIAQSIYLKKRLIPKSLIKTAVTGIRLGAAAGIIAQMVFFVTYDFLKMAKNISSIISSVLCWGIIGCGLGWGVSLFVPNYPTKRAMAAGFLGGLIGGAIFMTTLSLLPNKATGRIVGIIALGFFIGLTISCIEETLRKEWLTVIGGKNERKTISLGQKPLVFGSSPEADIYLSNEPPVRATVLIENSSIVTYDKTTNQRRELRNGDRVDLGKVSFVVNTTKAQL